MCNADFLAITIDSAKRQIENETKNLDWIFLVCVSYSVLRKSLSRLVNFLCVSFEYVLQSIEFIWLAK